MPSETSPITPAVAPGPAAARRIVLQTPELRLGIRPDLGGGVDDFAFAHTTGLFVPLWRSAPASTSFFNQLACYTLVPWCNRIAGAQFDFAGRKHVLKPDWPDSTAIHGCTKDLSWRILDRSPFSARLAFESDEHPACNWPWRFGAVQRYELDGFTLRMEVEITNRSDSPGISMPAGVGWHPFFPRTLSLGSGAPSPPGEFVVRAPISGRYPAVGMIPTGPATMDGVCERLGAGRPFDDLDLDDVFLLSRTDKDCFCVAWSGTGVSIDVAGSPHLGHMVVYSARDPAGTKYPFVCVEPVSMLNDGFNLASRGWKDTGVRTLAPGESWRVWTEWRVGREGSRA